MGIKRLTAEFAEPISLAQAKLHCRVDGTDDDALFEQIIIPAVREMAEHRTGRALVTQQWELTLDAFPVAAIEVPMPPLQSVQSIKYLDPELGLQDIDPAAYSVHTSSLVGLIARQSGTSWPAVKDRREAVTITFTAGYGTAAEVPASLKAWMLLAAGTLYQNREALATGQVVELPGGFWQHLLDPFIVLRIV